MGGPPAQRQILSGCGRRSGCGGGVFGLVAEAAQEAFYGDVFVEGFPVEWPRGADADLLKLLWGGAEQAGEPCERDAEDAAVAE